MTDPTQIVFITGANTGLGLEVVKALAASPSASYTIIVGCRDLSKGEAAIASVKEALPDKKSSFSTVQVDLSSDSSLEAAASTLASEFGHIDVLINNGGANLDFQMREEYEAAGGGGGSIINSSASAAILRKLFNQSWDINVTGSHILTTLVMPLLLKSANPKLLFITSGTASLAETERVDNPILQRLNASPEEKGWPKKQGGGGQGPATLPSPYRSSKVGLNMLMREWTRVLKNDGVKVWSISPGFLATGLGGVGGETLKKMGAKDPSEGGKFIRDVVEGRRDELAGKSIRVDAVQEW